MRKQKVLFIVFVTIILGANVSSGQLQRLEITAPEKATVNEQITIAVVADGTPVSGAQVYVNEEYIGDTADNGQINHPFNILGENMITARKTGFLPSDTHIITIEAQPVLVVTTTPMICDAGDKITITVQANHLPIAGATVLVKENATGGTYASINVTDKDGQITYTFANSGRYFIMAEKNGYTDSIPYPFMVNERGLGTSITMEGAVFPVPDSLKAKLSTQLLLPFFNTSVLVVKDRFVVVLSEQKIEQGLARVEGRLLANITWNGMNIEVIQAKNISVDQEGTPATIDEIKANPGEYALKLVKVNATLRQVSFLVDMDNENDVTIPITVGRVAENPVSPMDFTDFPGKAYDFEKDRTSGYLEGLLNLSGEGLPVFDFEPKYWADGTATVNAIVLSPTVVKEFIDAMAGNETGDLVIPPGEEVALYDVGTMFDSVNTSIAEIKADPGKYMGKVVTLDGSDIGVNVSVQETLKDTQGVYPPMDVLLQGAIAWWRPLPIVGEIQNGTLTIIGASSYHQDEALVTVNDALNISRYTGKIVSAEQVNASLTGTALILFEKKKIGNNSINGMTSEAEGKIQENLLGIQSVLQGKPPGTIRIPVIPPGETKIIEIDSGDIRNITMLLRNTVEHVSISVSKTEKRPSGVPVNASGEVYAYLAIDAANISDDDVENVSIEFMVNRSWITGLNLDESSVRLSRYSNGSWTVLPTGMVRETSTELYYSAESPGFSVYAITTVENGKAGGGMPGFELVSGVVAMALILLWKRRKTG